MAASIAPWTFSGVPSVATCLTLQPRILAASWRIGPWTAQASTPQLTNTIFLPVGTGLPIGCVTVRLSGRADAFWTPPLPGARRPESVDPVVPPPLAPPPQAAAKSDTAVIPIAAQARVLV